MKLGTIEGASSSVGTPFSIGLGIEIPQKETPPAEETTEPEDENDDVEIDLTPPEEEPTETTTASEEPTHEGRTLTSVLAEVYKQRGTLPDDFEITDDMSADALVEALEEAVVGRKSQEIEDDYRTKGYDDNLLEYSKFIAQGGNPQQLQVHVLYDQLSGIPLEDEENQKHVVRAMLQDQGVDAETIDDQIETLEINGKLEDRAGKAKTYFGKRKDAYFKQLQDERDAEIESQRKYVEEQATTYRNIIRKGEIAGTKLAAQDIKKLERDFLEPTEVVTLSNPDGTKYKQRITKFQKMMNDIQSSPEKTLELAALILGGLEPIKQKVKQDAKNEVLELLNAKQKITTSTQTQPKRTNGPLIDPATILGNTTVHRI